MVLGFVLADEGSEPFVKRSEPLGRGAHALRGHGVDLPTAA
jgi:hypothetical protein